MAKILFETFREDFLHATICPQSLCALFATNRHSGVSVTLGGEDWRCSCIIAGRVILEQVISFDFDGRLLQLLREHNSPVGEETVAGSEFDHIAKYEARQLVQKIKEHPGDEFEVVGFCTFDRYGRDNKKKTYKGRKMAIQKVVQDEMAHAVAGVVSACVGMCSSAHQQVLMENVVVSGGHACLLDLDFPFPVSVAPPDAPFQIASRLSSECFVSGDLYDEIGEVEVSEAFEAILARVMVHRIAALQTYTLMGIWTLRTSQLDNIPRDVMLLICKCLFA